MANVRARVAPQVVNTLTMPEVSLCLLDMEPAPAETLQTKLIADGRLVPFPVVPLVGAWVLVEPPQGEGPEPWLFKTSSGGGLQRLDPGSLGVKAHHDIHQAVLMNGFKTNGGVLTYAWCRDLSIFRSIIQDYVAHPSTWQERWPTATMRFAYDGVARLIQTGSLEHDDPAAALGGDLPAGFVDLSDAERWNMALLLHNQGPDGRTFFFRNNTNFFVEGANPGAIFFFARRPAIAAMFLAEVITRYGASLLDRSSDAYVTFAKGLALQQRLTSAESQYDELLSRPHPTTEQRYLLWAHDCGVARMSVADFEQTLPIGATNATFLVVLQEVLDRNSAVKAKHPLGATPDLWTQDPEHDPMLAFRDSDGTVFATFASWRVSSELGDYGDSSKFIASASSAKSSAAELVRQIAADEVLEQRSLLQQLIPEAIMQSATWSDFATLCERWMCAHLDVKRIWLEAISASTSGGKATVDPAGDAVADQVVGFVKLLGTAQNYYDLVTSFFDTKAAIVSRLVAESVDRIPNLIASANTLQKALGIQRVVDLTSLHLQVDAAHDRILVTGLGQWLGYFETVDEHGLPKVLVDEKTEAAFGTLFDEEQQEALAKIGFHSTEDRMRVPRMVGGIGAVATLAASVMGFQGTVKDEGAVAYVEVAKDTGYAVSSLAECVEGVLSMFAQKQGKALTSAVETAVEDWKKADAEVTRLKALVGPEAKKLTAASAALEGAPKSTSEMGLKRLKNAQKTAMGALNTADRAVADATAARDDIRAALPSSRALAFFDASLAEDEKAMAAIEKSSIVEHLATIIENGGEFADKVALPLDVLLTFRDGVIRLWNHADIAEDVQGTTEVVGAGIAGWLILDLGLAAAVPPATLVLAAVTILVLGVEAVEAIFSSPDDMLPMEKDLQDAKDREQKITYPDTWDDASIGLSSRPDIVCNTQAALLSLAAGLRRTLALPL